MSTSNPIKDTTAKNSLEKGNEELLTSTYISQMNSKEKIAYEIAKDHLGTSFNLKKSIGYKEWLKKNKEIIENKENKEKSDKK
jgi:hypothetical protein